MKRSEAGRKPGILYQCRYAPAEILRAMGAETEYIEPENADLSPAESALHPTVCSFAKAAYDEIRGRLESGDADGVLLTNCCDSTRRLYDALRAEFPGRFIYLTELPVKSDAAAREIYRGGVEALVRAYAVYIEQAGGGDGFAGFDPARLLAVLREENEAPRKPFASIPVSSPMRVGITGAKAPPALGAALERADIRVVFDLTCSGQKNRLYGLPADGASREEILDAYIRGVFSKYPCMRMVECGAQDKEGEGNGAASGAAARRAGLLDRIEATRAEGVVYHTLKFCEQYAYEYASLGDIGVPVLKLETEYTDADSGALATRVFAFAEQLRARPDGGVETMHTLGPPRVGVILGIDSGSTTTNAALFDRAAGRVLASAVVPTGPRVAESAEEARRTALARAGLAAAEIAETVATGYGRDGVPFADRAVTEITAHAIGARFLCPKVRTIIDIGGQDSKVIRIGEDGKVADFAMNDKCAAGTGRFLEMTAHSLGVPLAEIGGLALTARERLVISSMCTVFAESEVVSLVAQGKRVEDILWALCRAIAQRNEVLLKRASACPPYLMTGGVANNRGVVRALSERLGEPVEVPPEPEIAGAIGAALS